MNIAIDLRRRLGFGIQTYIRNVIHTLARLDAPGAGGPGHRYLLVGGPEQLREYRGLPENFTLQPFPRPASSFRAILGFRHILARHKTDLLHIPHMIKTPRFAPCPYVITVHDVLEFLSRKKQQTAWQRQLRFELAGYNLRKARAILAVSESTRQDLSQTFWRSVLDDKITVTYNAIDESFRQGHATDADRAMLAERYQVNYPFLLYAGSVMAHKNVVRLIDAFAALKAELKKDGTFPDLKLIIIGDDLSSNPELRRAALRGGVQNDVRFLGFVPVEALRIFYDLAKIFVFPSLYEGFGLPPLEAMAHGTPVVTSNVSSLPEVVGDAAVMVNPVNVFEIMHAMHRVLTDQPLREVMKQRGFEQSQKFTWEGPVKKLLEVYEAATQR